MIRLLKYFLYTLFIPFWWIQRLIPRNENIWVFGAWFGDRFADNPKALFNYINNNEPKYKTVWITRNKGLVSEMRKKDLLAYRANSLYGIYYILRASYVIVCNSKRDVNFLFINGAITVQLWHGIPMKKINRDVASYNLPLWKKKLVEYLFSFMDEYNYRYYLSNAPIFDEKIKSAFNAVENQIVRAGYPRNDIFFTDVDEPYITKLRNKYPDSRIIAYLPTHRGDYIDGIDYFSKYGYNIEKFNQFLLKNNLIFLFKGHFYVGGENEIFNYSSIEKRAFQIGDEDISSVNSFLNNIDILITDYSGAYFDFLLSNKPIVLAAFDLEEYISTNRELYFDFHKDINCGSIAYDWDNVMTEVENILKDDSNKKLRTERRDFFHAYPDGGNSKRVFEALKNGTV